MAVFNDLQLKQWFETGDFPTQQQFFNLIDSKVNVLDLPPLLGLNIGVTNIIGGADKNILFQAGSVVSQDNLFKYDYTNKRIGVNIAAPLSGFHVFSSTGNVDANPLTFAYQRDAVPANSNTTWFAHNALNSAGMRVGAFAFAQQAAGQGTRFSVLVTDNSSVTPATEGLRLSQEKRLSVGVNINNGATVDIHAEGNLSTDLSLRVRNFANTFDHFKVLGNGSVTKVNNQSTTYLNHIDENFTGSIIQVEEWRNGNNGGANEQTARLTNYRWNYTDPLLASTTVIASKTYATSVKNTFIINNENSNPDSAIAFNMSTSPSAVAFDAMRLTCLRNVLIGGTNVQAGTNATNTVVQYSGVAPASSPVDSFQMYSQDITAGNSAPHFRTENGAIIKIYQETTAVTASTLVGGGGANVTDTDTFDGYTLKQIVKALRNSGLLQ